MRFAKLVAGAQHSFISNLVVKLKLLAIGFVVVDAPIPKPILPFRTHPLGMPGVVWVWAFLKFLSHRLSPVADR
jgi:hypothetical protein